MTVSISPGTPVTVVLGGTYREAGGGRFVETDDGRFSRIPADALIVPAADGSDPQVLTPAIRSIAHRAARDVGVHATVNTAVEAALSALEPVLAGLAAAAAAHPTKDS